MASSPDELWHYRVRTVDGREFDIDERDLAVPFETDAPPLERLARNEWHGPERFFARLGLLERLPVWYENSDGLPSMLGARVIAHFHQMYAARRVLFDRVPRFVLADEVGLGKTIEAGLVIQALESRSPGHRILVVAPGATSRQWLCELYLRFGGRVFTHLDAVEYNRRTKRARAEALAARKLIVTTTLLREQPEVLARIREQPWDVLVVDEAHNLHPKDPLFVSLRGISDAARGALILSATPSRREENGLLALLALAAPASYAPEDLESFRERTSRQAAIWDKLSYSSAVLAAAGDDPSGIARELAEEWTGVVEDEVIRSALERMRAGDFAAAEELVAHIQEHHRVDHRIIRTRRATLDRFQLATSTRQLEILDYAEDACVEERGVVEHFQALPALVPDTEAAHGLVAVLTRAATITPECLETALAARRDALAAATRGPTALPSLTASDVGPAEEAELLTRYIALAPSFRGEGPWLERARALAAAWKARGAKAVVRFTVASRWIEDHLRTGADRKVVVFAQERALVEAFASALRQRLGPTTVVESHHMLDEAALAEAATKFQTQSACRVLVSDELGGEGRNFHFASAVVHLDQPWHVARIEQRIGRLDRIKRAAGTPVRSVVLLGPESMERALFALHRDVFQVYGRSLGGLEFVLPRLQARVVQAAGQGSRAMEALARVLSGEVELERQTVDRAFMSALDSTLPELERAAAVAKFIDEHDGTEDTAPFSAWARHLGLHLETRDDLTTISGKPETLKRPLPDTPAGERWSRVGSFAREYALSHENVHYFGPGHVLIDALVADAIKATDACAAVFERDLGFSAMRRVFALIVMRTELDGGEWPDGVPAGLANRVYRRLWPQWISIPVELQLEDERLEFDLDKRLRGNLLRSFNRGEDSKLRPESLLALCPTPERLWRLLSTAVAEVETRIGRSRVALVLDAVSQLEEDLRAEMAYLRGVVARSREPTAAQDLDDRERLLRSARNERIRLDSVAIIVGGGRRRR